MKYPIRKKHSKNMESTDMDVPANKDKNKLLRMTRPVEFDYGEADTESLHYPKDGFIRSGKKVSMTALRRVKQK